MDKEKVTEIHRELKQKITQILWDFTEKYFTPDENPLQIISIVQSVLCESVSEVEYQAERCAPLTRNQIDHICYQIDKWYLAMKSLLEGQRNLGFMKEKLKLMVCGVELDIFNKKEQIK